MVTASSVDGFGNQMFPYTGGRVIALRCRTSMALGVRR